MELLHDGCAEIGLGDVSGEDNAPGRALATGQEAVRCEGLKPGEDVVIQAQKRNEASDWMEF